MLILPIRIWQSPLSLTMLRSNRERLRTSGSLEDSVEKADDKILLLAGELADAFETQRQCRGRSRFAFGIVALRAALICPALRAQLYLPHSS
jgi:hypothetical protein